MGDIVLNEEDLSLIAKFERITGASSRDCVIDEKNERIIFVVNPGEMGKAIGKKGSSIKKASDMIGKRIEVVEYSKDPVQFIRNCFLPAQVASIDFIETDSVQSVNIGVRDEDKGLAIGKEGKNIFKVKKLASRQHNIEDVQIVDVS